MTKKEFKPKKDKYGQYKFIGKEKDSVTYYFVNPIEFDCNWYWGGIYLTGTNTETEESLRERARSADPSDYGIDTTGFAGRYFDEEAFLDDLEDKWEESADIEFEQEIDGKTIYHCFSTHTHFDGVLLNKYQGKYEQFIQDFDTPLTKKQFNILIKIARQFYKLRNMADKQHGKDNKEYLKAMKELEVILIQWENAIMDLLDLPNIQDIDVKE